MQRHDITKHKKQVTMNKSLLSFYFLLLITHVLNAQSTRVVSGKITDEKGNFVEAASIRSVNSKTFTVVDLSGHFTIAVSGATDTLIIQAMGYIDERIYVNEKMNGEIKVTLRFNSKQLAEVIVNTGYQKVSKERSTGSFEKIDPALYNRTVTTDVLSRLEGITSGLFVSRLKGYPEYFIRGLSTLNASTGPLIVVDDFPYEGDINNINPNDVENIVVLKDAAAASIWGARSGNGVIVITTKKARFEQLPSLSIAANVMVQQKPDLFYSKAFLAAPQFIDLEKDLFARGYYDNDLANTYSWPIVSPVVDLLDKARRGEITQAQADAQINQFKQYDVRNDYSKNLYQKAVNQQYALNLSGGSKTLNYILSLGYDKDLSSVRENDMQRITARQSTSFKPLQWLSLQADINYTNTKNVNNGIATIYPGLQKGMLYPYARLADANGTPLAVEKDYRLQYIDTTGGGQLLDWTYKPLSEMHAADRTIVTQDIVTKLNLTARVMPSLTASLSGQFEKSNNDGKNYNSPETYFTRDLINRFTTIDGNTVNRTIPYGGILDRSFSELATYSLRGQLNYAKNWRTKHSVAAIAGAEVRQVHVTSQLNRTYGYNDNLLTYSSVDWVNEYPLYGNFGYGYIPDYSDFQDVMNRFTSLYANASYTYQNLYTVSASARKDAANIFGVDANQKGVPLWSAGAAYKISNAGFYKADWLPMLKFRMTYGYNGNMRTDLASVPVISFSGYPNRYTHLPFASITNLANKELRWERVGMVNIGVDFGLKADRLTGTVEYYHKDAKDLLSPAPLDPTLGLNNMIYNVANMSGKGIDIKLTAKIIDKAFQWNVTALYSYVSNKVTKYLLDYPVKGGYVTPGTNIAPIEGKDPYSVVTYRFRGLDHNTGNPLGTLNGKESTDYYSIVNTTSWDDLRFVGSARAPHFGNLISTVSWKGWAFSFNVNFKAGYYFMKSSINYSALLNNWTGHEDYNKRWQNPGDELRTNVPSIVYAADPNRDAFYLQSDANVLRGDLIRLQDLRLSYDWNRKGSQGPVFKSAQLYVIGSNLGILWRANKEGIDPDCGDGMPNPRAITIGIKTNF
jgi:TonB-linked SusC/RagA family outer membrane protein